MMNHWLFRCKDITELISKSYDEKLSWGARLGIRFHLKMCHLCTRYKRQLDLIQKALACLNADTDNIPEKTMPEEAKSRLKESIR